MHKFTWELLEILKGLSSLPWLCGGDFNEILSNTEKWGGPIRPPSQITDFQNISDICALRDLGFFGIPWTWTNKQDDGVLVKVRLDKFVAGTKWFDIFPCFRVDNVKGYESDHNVIVLNTNFNDMSARCRRHFKFEATW